MPPVRREPPHRFHAGSRVHSSSQDYYLTRQSRLPFVPEAALDSLQLQLHIAYGDREKAVQRVLIESCPPAGVHPPDRAVAAVVAAEPSPRPHALPRAQPPASSSDR